MFSLERPHISPISSDIHGIAEPADVREGEQVSASGRIKGWNLELPMQVWRLSPFGIELIIPEDSKPIDVGNEIDLILQLGEQRTELRGLVVCARARVGQRELLGIRWTQTNTDPQPQADRRSTERWMCAPEYLPTGVAPNPARFNDFIHFRVRDVSRNGLQILTSLRNKFIVPGMVLDSVISLPTIGHIKVSLKVINARTASENGKDYLSIGMQVINHSGQSLEMLGQFILQFGPKLSLESIRNSGFNIVTSKRVVEFNYVRSSEDYKDVLELRRRAYSNVYKGDPFSVQHGDVYDARSRILMAKYQGELVGTLRMIFNDSSDSFEHESHVTFSSAFPRRDEIVEVSRVCTDPKYRGGDLLFGMFRQMALALLQSGRRYILGYSPSNLWKIYTRLGARPTGETFLFPEDRPRAEQTEIIPFLIDAYSCFRGAGLNFVTWNAVFGDMLAHVDTKRIMGADPIVSVRLAIFKLLGPLSQLIAARISRPRKAKKKGKK